jgi:hypothetical protein
MKISPPISLHLLSNGLTHIQLPIHPFCIIKQCPPCKTGVLLDALLPTPPSNVPTPTHPLNTILPFHSHHYLRSTERVPLTD